MNKLLLEGKSKLVYAGPEKETLILQYKDIATAFNGEKKEALEGKGKINAAISNLIYNYLAEHGIETHLHKIIDDTSVLVKKADIILVEVIVRNIAAGSFSKKYNIAEGTVLKNTVVEFCLKSDELGDPLLNESQVTAIGLASKEELVELNQYSLKVNELLCALFWKTGIRLVDFKLEFGRYNGKIILCDEISPDSCRLWDIRNGKKLDKDRFRQNLGSVLESYQDVLGRLQNVR